jgi:hypothetical protein
MVTEASYPTPFDALVPISDSYATMPLADAFDWTAAAAACEPGEWYLVAFRSVQHPDVDQGMLQAYDDRAHHEAQGSPGFVHYFKGPANAARQCLSFCIWESRHHAREAAGRPDHAAAAAIVHTTYSTYTLEFLRVTKRVDADRFDFEPYDAMPATVPLVDPTDLSLTFSPAV